MVLFKVQIEDRAIQDIKKSFEYYEEKQVGLGIRFNQEVFLALDVLKSNPFYQIRYSTFRCYPMRRFPFMIHYEVNEESKTVLIFAVINTSLNPEEKWIKG